MGKIDKKEKKEKKEKKDKKEKKSKDKKKEEEAVAVTVATQPDDDRFDVLAEIKDTVVIDEEAKAAAKEKAEKKKLRKKLTDEEKETQRKINRENREKKKEKKALNKKRKKGELEVSDDEDDEQKEPELDEEGNPIEPKPKKVKTEKKKKEIEYGIWVGNLSYATTSNAIKEFFKDCGEITRMKCPKGNGAKNNNKGFAYVFFATAEQAAKAVEKSEQKLEGRSLLIKDSENFERKDGVTMTEADRKVIKKQKNPPCPTLFIGNLSFQTKEEHLREAFEWAGDIRKVRMATFEDSGKCKGFGYVDFYTVESATKAIRAPDKHMIDGRRCRVEFAGEEAYKRSMPWLLREEKKQKEAGSGNSQQQQQQQHNSNEGGGDGDNAREFRPRREKPEGEFRERREKPKKPVYHGDIKSGQALADAQRQKPTVQEFKGTKVTFD